MSLVLDQSEAHTFPAPNSAGSPMRDPWLMQGDSSRAIPTNDPLLSDEVVRALFASHGEPRHERLTRRLLWASVALNIVIVLNGWAIIALGVLK